VLRRHFSIKVGENTIEPSWSASSLTREHSDHESMRVEENVVDVPFLAWQAHLNVDDADVEEFESLERDIKRMVTFTSHVQTFQGDEKSKSYSHFDDAQRNEGDAATPLRADAVTEGDVANASDSSSSSSTILSHSTTAQDGHFIVPRVVR